MPVVHLNLRRRPRLISLGESLSIGSIQKTMASVIFARVATLSLFFVGLSGSFCAETPPVIANPEIVTDRPDVTESSIVVPKGSLQVENGATWTTDHASQNSDLSESLIRLGAATRTEIRIVVPNRLHSARRAEGDRPLWHSVQDYAQATSRFSLWIWYFQSGAEPLFCRGILNPHR